MSISTFQLFKVKTLVNLEETISPEFLQVLIKSGFGTILEAIWGENFTIFDGYRVKFPDEESKEKMQKCLRILGLGQTDFQNPENLELNIFI
jgi:hypothetical protein